MKTEQCLTEFIHIVPEQIMKKYGRGLHYYQLKKPYDFNKGDDNFE